MNEPQPNVKDGVAWCVASCPRIEWVVTGYGTKVSRCTVDGERHVDFYRRFTVCPHYKLTDCEKGVSNG